MHTKKYFEGSVKPPETPRKKKKKKIIKGKMEGKKINHYMRSRGWSEVGGGIPGPEKTLMCVFPLDTHKKSFF